MVKHGRAGGGNPDQDPGKHVPKGVREGVELTSQDQITVPELLARLAQERRDARKG